MDSYLISIHALLAESDLRVLDGSKSSIEISIHALLAESDNANLGRHRRDNDFYPRSPCGERRLQLFLNYQDNKFLSTLSLRRATQRAVNVKTERIISIHALLAESDANNQRAQQEQHISIHALLAESD